ncbi:MAG: tetratricopeptide repeat protein [Armatimonadota bacterium]
MKLKMIKNTALVLVLLAAAIYMLSPGASASNMDEGIQLFYQRDWNAAAQKFEASLVENPYDNLAVLYVLDCYEKEKNLSAISNKFEQEVMAKPDDALAISNLGMAYFARSLINSSFEVEAIEQFKKALKLDPKLGSAYTGLGLVYYQKRMIPRAKAYFYKAFQLNPNDVVAAEFIGNILLVDDKKPDEALIYFQKIAELVPNYPDAYYYIGSSFYDLGQYNESISYLSKCSELDPLGVTQGYYSPQLIGDIYLKEKNYPAAVSAFEQALKINPQNSYAKYKLEKAKNPGKEDKKPRKEAKEEDKTEE